MKSLNQDNFMKICNFLSLILFFLISCNSSTRVASTIIRDNVFDSKYYRLNNTDTNRVNKLVYDNISRKVQMDTSTRLLLLRNYSTSIIFDEYGLYDYNTKKYYYCSVSEKFQLVEYSVPNDKQILKTLQYFIDNASEKALSEIKNSTRISDGLNYELDLINVNEQSEIMVKSYYW